MAFHVDKPYLNTPQKEVIRVDYDEDDEGEDQLDNLFEFWSKRPDVHVPKAGSVTLAHLDKDNHCHRCGKKVYPVEKVDVGVLYHKGCFKCRVCSRQLTLQTFQRDLDIDASRIKEVYCSTHVPRQAATGYGSDALGIRSAVDAQKRASKKIHHHVFPDHHYEPDYARRPTTDLWSSEDESHPPDLDQYNQQEPEIPSLGENKFLQDDKERPEGVSDVTGGVSDVTPVTEHLTEDTEQEVTEIKDAGIEEVAEVEPTSAEEKEADVRNSLLMRRESVKERNSTIRRRSTLRSFQDFERHGVFDAQSMLERAQREEEDQLYDQIESERRTLRQRLDEALRAQREHSVNELRQFFMTNEVASPEQEAALIKVEEYYRRRREAALRSLLQRLATEEQAAVARMVEKHSNEMIQLIRKKDRLASQSSNVEVIKPVARTIHPLPSTPTPPLTGRRENQEPTRHQATPRVDTSTSSDVRPASAFSAVKNARLERELNSVRTTNIRQTPEIEEDDDLADIARLSVTEKTGGWEEEEVEEEKVEEGNESLEFIPEAEPPESRKEQLYSDPDVFKEQDRRAIEESKKDHRTFTDLVRQLSKRCQTELQKVRSIFRWVTVKDLNRMKFDERVDPNSPLGLLRGIKMGTESYHDLFRRLCSYAGLHCEVIEGYSKGAGYRPGDTMSGETFRNQWTAVWVDGSWRFINCKWGARHVKATRDINLTYKCDEFYFLTDPEDHIYQHFPDEPDWQLLKAPLSLHQFINLPVVKSPFFNARLSLAFPYPAVLDATEGQTEVKLTSPRLVSVAAKLKSTSREIPSEILQDRTVVRYAGEETVITVNLPSPGVYYLDVYVAPEWESDRMDSACAFQINCCDISRDANMTYPQVGGFGRTPGFTECGMEEESHNDPYIITDGDVTFTFRLSKNVSLRPTLRRWDPRDRTTTDYDRYVLYRQRTSQRSVFDVQLARRGFFILSIYVTNPDDPKSTMVSIYKYLIDCKSPKLDAYPYPKASKRFKHCNVIEPLCGDLTPETTVKFRYESRRAVDMMVVFNNKTYSLKVEGGRGREEGGRGREEGGRKGGGEGGKVWTGEVFINVPTGKLMVYSRFESSGDKYIPMLEYQITNRRQHYNYLA